MNFRIVRRRKAGGLFGERDDHYVDVTIEFSDAERGHIHQDPERFQTHILAAGYDAPAESLRSPRNTKRISWFVLLVALLLLASSLVYPGFGSFNDVIWLLALAAGGWLYGTFFDYEGDPASDEIRLGAVVNETRTVLHAQTEALAQQTETDLRKRLDDLKAMLAASSPAAALSSLSAAGVPMRAADIIFAAAVVLAIAASLYYAPRIKSDRVAMQWGWDGKPTWHAPKWVALWGTVAFMLAVRAFI